MKPSWPAIWTYLKAQHAAIFAVMLTLALHLQGCIPAPTPPAPVSEVLPATAKGTVGKMLELDAQTSAAVSWQVFGHDPAQTRAHGNKIVLTPQRNGQIIVLALVAKGSSVVTYECDVTVGDAPPPVPPGPVPPKPDPTPPAPIPDAGLRVLITYDLASLAAMPQSQQSILDGKAIRDYLNTVCTTGAGKKEWRIWEKGTDATNEPSAPMKALFARPRASVPWIAISNGKTGFEGPLPADVPAAQALIEKYKQ